MVAVVLTLVVAPNAHPPQATANLSMNVGLLPRHCRRHTAPLRLRRIALPVAHGRGRLTLTVRLANALPPLRRRRRAWNGQQQPQHGGMRSCDGDKHWRNSVVLEAASHTLQRRVIVCQDSGWMVVAAQVAQPVHPPSAPVGRCHPPRLQRFAPRRSEATVLSRRPRPALPQLQPTCTAVDPTPTPPWTLHTVVAMPRWLPSSITISAWAKRRRGGEAVASARHPDHRCNPHRGLVLPRHHRHYGVGAATTRRRLLAPEVVELGGVWRQRARRHRRWRQRGERWRWL